MALLGTQIYLRKYLMKLVIISFYAITVNHYYKDLLVQTQRNKYQQKIFDLFKLINKDNTAMPLTKLWCCYYQFSTLLTMHFTVYAK